MNPPATIPPVDLENPRTPSKADRFWLHAGCLLLVVAATLHSANCPIGGGDTWVAMACGRFTLGPWAEGQTGRTWQMKVLDKLGLHLTQRDFMGARTRDYVPGDKEKIGWINQNWLTHALLYKLKALGTQNPMDENRLGESLIVVYKFFQALLTALFAYWAARVLGAHPVLAAAAVSFGTLLSRSFIDLRPNVSSILFAVILILILAYWRKRRYTVMWWIIPVMILWSNVHGGFIYAIMIFLLFAGAQITQSILAEFAPHAFYRMDGRGFGVLMLGTAAAIVIPVVFSPFGMENLVHPLMIATGQEGKEWRRVVEWLPIWDKNGFGNATPYLFFLGLLVLVFMLWWISYAGKPAMPQYIKNRRGRRENEPFCRPRIDLGWLAIAAITVMMSIKSRRFIYLGGLVLAPFLAQWAQESITMLALWYRNRRHFTPAPPTLPPLWRKGLTLGCWLAALILGGIFYACMYDVYLAPAKDGLQHTIFRRMVGINDQPVQAMQFVRENPLQGLVLNEWVQGGFITFHQAPRAENGQVRCRVFMDGRAQAAYDLKHYKHHGSLMAASAQTDPEFYHDILERDGINIVMVDYRKSKNLFDILWRTQKWVLIYFDGHQMSIWINREDSRNRDILALAAEDQLHWPSEDLHHISRGFRMAASAKPEFAREGLELLCRVQSDTELTLVYDMIFKTAMRLRQLPQLEPFFAENYRIYKDRVDRGERFGRQHHFNKLIGALAGLSKIAGDRGDHELAKRYQNEFEHYDQERDLFFQNERKKGWLW